MAQQQGMGQPPPLVVQAEQWGTHNAAFLTSVFTLWQADRQWPDVDVIGRQAIREDWGFDAFELAEALPRGSALTFGFYPATPSEPES